MPVWFEWDGASARVFSGATSGKVRRLERDPRATLLVTNTVGEPEAWVAFDARASVRRDGAIELAERLAHRYWDMNDPAKQVELEGWRQAASTLIVIELQPDAIRTSKG